MDVGTDAVLISKLYHTHIGCNDGKYDECNNNVYFDSYCLIDNPACHFENGTFNCKHTGTYEICLEDPKLFCTNNSQDEGRDDVTCCEFHPIFASSFLFFFLLTYLISWITWARLTELPRRWYTFIFPLLNCFPQFGEFYKFK